MTSQKVKFYCWKYTLCYNKIEYMEQSPKTFKVYKEKMQIHGKDAAINK